MQQTREQIITNMCYTWRHDYGLDRPLGDFSSSGMSQSERVGLWNQMAQVFDHVIAPNVTTNPPYSYAQDSARTDWIEP